MPSSFVVRLDGTIEPHIILTQSQLRRGSGQRRVSLSEVRPIYFKTHMQSNEFGLFYILHLYSYQRVHTELIRENINTINMVATNISSNMDTSSRWVMVGDCYFVFESDNVTIDKLNKFNKISRNTLLISPNIRYFNPSLKNRQNEYATTNNSINVEPENELIECFS